MGKVCIDARALTLSEVEGSGRAAPPRPSTSLRMRLFVLFAAIFAALPAHAQELHPLTPHPEGVPWPSFGFAQGEMAPETAALIKPLIDRAMEGEKGEPMGETRSIVIVHGGRIVAEAYREGFDRDTKQMSWSMAKSITSALVGRAVHLGLIDDIDVPMPTLFPDGDPRGEITWRQWLNMTEGLSNHELSPTGHIHENFIAQQMFGRGKYDVAQFSVDELEVEETPGEVWKYSTTGYHMIGWALKEVQSGGRHQYSWDAEGYEEFRVEALRDMRDKVKFNRAREFDLNQLEKTLNEGLKQPEGQRVGYVFDTLFRQWMQRNFFYPLNMRATQPEFDAAGTYLGGSNVWASAHDYAKFGYLYLRDGVWQGERLLPEGWVDFARSKTTGKNNNTYGAGFWITAYGEEPTTDQAVYSPPWDAFNANGSEGQTIWIVPSRDLVIVRTGQMANTMENWNMLFEWCQEIARAFPEVQLAP